MHERLAERLAGVGIPELRRVVRAARGDRRTVGAERNGQDLTLMPERWSDRPAGVGVPEPRRPVVAGRRDGLAVGAERHGVDRSLVCRSVA